MMVFKLASPATIVDAGFDWQDKGIAVVWSALRTGLGLIVKNQECLNEGRWGWYWYGAPHGHRHGGSLNFRLKWSRGKEESGTQCSCEKQRGERSQQAVVEL